MVAISDKVRQRIVRGRLCPHERVEVLHPGIAAARIAPGRRPEPYVLIAGRIMWTKDLRLGLEAFALVRARLPGWRLVIAGVVDEKSREYASELMARAEKVSAVAFRTNPTDHQLPDLYEGCTALLFTAFNEDSGLTPLEAMAAGRAVIAVNRGGPRESVADGATGRGPGAGAPGRRSGARTCPPLHLGGLRGRIR